MNPPFQWPGTKESTTVIPIRDDNPRRTRPVITWLLIGALFLVWIFVQAAGFDEMALAASGLHEDPDAW